MKVSAAEGKALSQLDRTNLTQERICLVQNEYISSVWDVKDFLDKFKEQFGVAHIMHGLPVLRVIFY